MLMHCSFVNITLAFLLFQKNKQIKEGRKEKAQYAEEFIHPIPCATRIVVPKRVYASKNFPMLTRYDPIIRRV